jgi:hypothetical protein
VPQGQQVQQVLQDQLAQLVLLVQLVLQVPMVDQPTITITEQIQVLHLVILEVAICYGTTLHRFLLHKLTSIISTMMV